MRNNVLKKGETVNLPATHDGVKGFYPYRVVSKEKGGIYHLEALSRYTLPHERTIRRTAKHAPVSDTCRKAA